MSAMRVAICGAGVVGGGVLSILSKLRGIPFQVTKVLVRDVEKARGTPLPHGATYVTDWRECMEDTDLVVELIGGTTVAKDIVFTALESGIDVVTANKALIASEMTDLENVLAAESAGSFGYEAAVGGGIPVIRGLQNSITASDYVTSVSGILNGTTNYMLSKMSAEGSSYATVLKEAQDAGFAEADPTADVEGHDARAKIAILSRLALGCHVEEKDIPCAGIAQLTADDFAYANMLDSTIKLVATARKMTPTDGNPITVQSFVTPCICPRSGSIANVNGAMNVVKINSASLGSSYLMGAGAGSLPTANSVVADMMALQNRSIAAAFPVPLVADAVQDPDYYGRFYIRLNVRDQTGIIMTAGSLCHCAGISLHAVLQTPILDPENVPFVITTDECRRSQIASFCDACEEQPWCLEPPLIMPMLE